MKMIRRQAISENYERCFLLYFATRVDKRLIIPLIEKRLLSTGQGMDGI